MVDFRRSTKTYYQPYCETPDLPAHKTDVQMAEALDAEIVEAAVREAQSKAPGYSYVGFCEKVMAAGCAG